MKKAVKKTEIVLTKCKKCPNRIPVDIAGKIIQKCFGKGTVYRTIDDIRQIPDWCPLEDAEESALERLLGNFMRRRYKPALVEMPPETDEEIILEMRDGE
jgi:hypothetical protein